MTQALQVRQALGRYASPQERLTGPNAMQGIIEKVLRSVALLPWSHNLLLLSKGFNDEATLYYAQETITKGWNRDLLLNAIKLNMYETQALAGL